MKEIVYALVLLTSLCMCVCVYSFARKGVRVQGTYITS